MYTLFQNPIIYVLTIAVLSIFILENKEMWLKYIEYF